MIASHRVLRILALTILAASVATVGLSFYAAHVTGYDYAPLNTFRTYTGVLYGSALVMVGVLLGGVLTVTRVDSAAREILGSLRDRLRQELNWPVPRSQVRRLAREYVDHGGEGLARDEVGQELAEYEALVAYARNLRSLLAAPVGLLAAIFAIASWALPAETFLHNVPVLNTTLVFFVTYGTVVAAAAVLVTAVVMLSVRAERLA